MFNAAFKKIISRLLSLNASYVSVFRSIFAKGNIEVGDAIFFIKQLVMQ